MNKLVFLLIYIALTASPCSRFDFGGGKIPSFAVSSNYQEQILTYSISPDVRISINAPSVHQFDPDKPTLLVFYALPNGNTIEQTIGKQIGPLDDWHYDIQHIGAQIRFVRSLPKDENYVIIYLEARSSAVPLSWPFWRKTHPDHPALVKRIVDSIKALFAPYHPSVILSGHSGGGGFIFSYLDATEKIPADIKRITFLESDYNYENPYGAKLCEWLQAANDHFLTVLTYNDSVAVLNGKPIVSPTGGTWYRTKKMAEYLGNQLMMNCERNDSLIVYSALRGRVQLILRENPDKRIFHTILVERNGFIHCMLAGSPAEGSNYSYLGPRAYSAFIQPAGSMIGQLQIPPRQKNAMTGSQFMSSAALLSKQEREEKIFTELSAGNLPDFLRTMKRITTVAKDAGGNSHTLMYETMPDYLAIGSDSDFCRIPMTPQTAQRLADLFGASLPTQKLVDEIYHHAGVQLQPIFYAPVGNRNESISKFLEHQKAIESQRLAIDKPLGVLVAGIKKDVVISALLSDTTRKGHVVIYGWHTPEGTPIQPLSNIHSGHYVDYSHGIRLINAEMIVDSTTMTVTQILQDSLLFKLISTEPEPMQKTRYEIPDSHHSSGL